MKKYLLTSLSILLFLCSQNSFAQSKKDSIKHDKQPLPIKEYYESGKIKVEGFVKNNRYDSTFISYYENGQVESQGSFKDCVYETNTTRRERMLMTCGRYVKDISKIEEGKKNGEWSYFYSNGKIKKKENYLCDFEVGLLVEYDSNGVIKRKAFYSEGRIIEDKNYESGNLTELYLYNYESRLKENSYTIVTHEKRIEYYETGEVMIIENNINGDYEGEYTEFWQNGFPMIKEEYRDGLVEGESYEYYENGNTKFMGLFKNDEPDGKHYHYNEKGKMTKIETWKKGKLIKTEIPNQE
jgi:antitoxin component YwqK of YwqJK toxin-antitoxin module